MNVVISPWVEWVAAVLATGYLLLEAVKVSLAIVEYRLARRLQGLSVPRRPSMPWSILSPPPEPVSRDLSVQLAETVDRLTTILGELEAKGLIRWVNESPGEGGPLIPSVVRTASGPGVAALLLALLFAGSLHAVAVPWIGIPPFWTPSSLVGSVPSSLVLGSDGKLRYEACQAGIGPNSGAVIIHGDRVGPTCVFSPSSCFEPCAFTGPLTLTTWCATLKALPAPPGSSPAQVATFYAGFQSRGTCP